MKLKTSNVAGNKDLLNRPDWDTYYMDIARVVAKRSNCMRRSVAAIIVIDQRIVSTGYNGTPRGIKNCFEGGCARCSSDIPAGKGLGECICAHAEENAITQAAYHGIALKNGAIYSTLSPCLTCARMIINSGIREVIYEKEYEFTVQIKDLFGRAGVRCRRFARKH